MTPWIKRGVMVIGVICGVELASFALVEGILAQRWGGLFVSPASKATETDRVVPSSGEESFDGTLGWVRPAVEALPTGGLVVGHIALLGPATEPGGSPWRQLLADRTGMAVRDLTVADYGTDQAVRRLELELAAGQHFDVAILSITGDDIRSILGAYLPFRLRNTHHGAGFKPVLERTERGWTWVEPALKRQGDARAEAEAVNQAAAHDHFYRIGTTMPHRGFPYALGVARTFIYMARLKLLGQRQLLPNGGNTDDLWRWEPARQRMAALIDMFRRLGDEHGFRAVVLFQPSPAEVEAMDAGAKGREYRLFARDLWRTTSETKLAVIDMLDQPVRPSHLFGSEGGRAAAKAVTAILGRNNLCQLTTENGTPPLIAASAENARVRIDGPNMVLVAVTNDPILFLPRLNGQPRQLDIELTSPADTTLELFIITDRSGYGQVPYRAPVKAGRNVVSLSLHEDEPLLLRIDPGMVQGTYVIHSIAITGECP